MARQRLSRSKEHAKAELIAEVHRDSNLDELDSSINLECLELDPFDCEHVKSPISNMVYENNKPLLSCDTSSIYIYIYHKKSYEISIWPSKNL